MRWQLRVQYNTSAKRRLTKDGVVREARVLVLCQSTGSAYCYVLLVTILV